MDLCKITEPLDDLYTNTNMDWNLDISLSLTEPVCPVISIRPETTNITRYTAHCSTNKLEETLTALVERVRLEIIEGKNLTSRTVPYTNPDDKIMEEWLLKRQTNPHEPFPYMYFYNRFHKKEGYTNEDEV